MTTDTLQVRTPAWGNSIQEVAVQYSLDADRLKLVLHQFFLAYLKNNIMRRMDKSGKFDARYFSVSATLLKEVGTKYYAKYARACVDAGWVEKKRSKHAQACYVVGGHAQLYRWTFPSDWERPKFKKEHINSYKSYKAAMRLRDTYKDQHPQVPSYSNAASNIFELLASYVKQVRLTDRTVPDLSSDTNLLYLEALSNGDLYWFKQDDYGHRLHHPYTAVKKKDRQFLRFEGHMDVPLTEVDISNSQPYLLSISNSPELIKRFVPEFIPAIDLIEKYADSGSMRLFREHCIDGKLYELLMAALPDKDRDIVKELMFSAVLFSRKRLKSSDIDKRKFRRAFKLLYPEVIRFVDELKKLDETQLPALSHIIKPAGKRYKYKGANDSYKLPSLLLQRIESAIMYQVIVPALIQVGIGPMLTIHDSVMVLASKKAQAAEIIMACFISLGVKPPKLK